MELEVVKHQIGYYARQVGDLIWCKLGFSLVYAAMVPHGIALQGLALLFVMDFLCGVWVAHKTHSLTSAGVRRGVAKALVYTLFISAVALCEHSVLQTGFITTGAIGLLGATELLSITENLVMLGLPIPYGAKVLRMISQKAKNFGFNFDAEDINSLGYAKDLVEIITIRVPQLRDPELRTCMKVFTTEWYSYTRELTEQAFMGGRELAGERIRASIEKTIVDTHSILTRLSIPLAVQRTFLQNWAGDLISRLLSQVAEVTLSNLPTDCKPDRVREAVTLMLYRLINEVDDLDGLDRPLETRPDIHIAPGAAADLTRPVAPDVDPV